MNGELRERALRRRIFSVMDRLLSRTSIGSLVPPNLRARLAFAVGRKQIDRREQLYRFWRQRRPHRNYFVALESSARSETIITMLSPWITPDARIFEVGCNVGRNLNHLYRAGYTRLGALEISAAAVERLRSAYPRLATVKVDIGAAETVLLTYPSRSFDVVFTMAVLEHIHPTSRVVFSEIARVARRYVLAIEPRGGRYTHRTYPWDVPREFEVLGLRLLDRRPWSGLWRGALEAENEWDASFRDYDAFLFEIPGADAPGAAPSAVQAPLAPDGGEEGR